LFAEHHTGPLRFCAEIYDSRAYFADTRTPITAIDVNAAEFVQAYAALDSDEPFGAGSHATAQLGRFVLNFGSRRLVTADDYRNTTNVYTGLRGDVTLRKVTNGYRAKWAADAEADLRTTVDTAPLSGANPFQTILGAVSA
jgi:hypothetical protein